MALFRRFFYRKPPDGLLEISERVFVFDFCFTTEILDDDEYKVYIEGIFGQLREYIPDASFMVFNFREGEHQSLIANILSEYDVTVIDYPRQYENCPVLTVEMIHHFLKSSESWLSLLQKNVLLMHCERGGWPVLAFMLAALLLYRKQYTGEQKTLDMIYKQAPREILNLISPLDPLPSQLRYLQYISRRNVASVWPPLDRPLTLDCIILRVIPDMDGEGGFHPIVRVYGQDPLMAAVRTPKVLFSTPKKSKGIRHYKQAECGLVKIDINCHIRGDVVLECITVDSDLEREKMMFRVMFNTAFIRSNILMLNRDEIDILWNMKDQFPKDFRAEVIFSEMNSTSLMSMVNLSGIDDKEGLPIEAFSKVQEIFNNVDWLYSKPDVARSIIHQITASDSFREKFDSVLSKRKEHLERVSLKEDKNGNLQGGSLPLARAENFDFLSPQSAEKEQLDIVSPKKVKEGRVIQDASADKVELSKLTASDSGIGSSTAEIESQELQAALQTSAESKLVFQRSLKGSLSKPASYCNSLQGSPATLSRYHSAPSNLGITALLHDHTMSENNGLHSMALSSKPSVSSSFPCLPTHATKWTFTVQESQPPPSKEISSDVVTLQSSTVPPPPPPSPPQLPPPPPPPPPQPAVPTLHHSASEELNAIYEPCSVVQAQDRGKPRSVPPPPPLPFSLSELSRLSSIKKSIPAPPTPPLPRLQETTASFLVKNSLSVPCPPLPPPSSSCSGSGSSATVKNKSLKTPPPAPPILTTSASTTREMSSLLPKISAAGPPPPPPPPIPTTSASTTRVMCSLLPHKISAAAPPPPLPLDSGLTASPSSSSVPAPPPPPNLGVKEESMPKISRHVPPVPPPPAPFANLLPKAGCASLPPHSCGSNGKVPPPAPPLVTKGRLQSCSTPKNQSQSRKSNLKPYHWLKLTRAVQGSLWAEAQKPNEASTTPEFDMSELESLFAASIPNSDHGSTGGKSNRRASGPKSDKVNLIELRRAYNCEIMLTKVKIPLSDLVSSVLTLDDSALDVDQVDNLIKFCPTKEETELLKNYKGDKENLGRCEQFFLELMKVPRVQSKLRVFSFKMQFTSQVSDLRKNLNVINSVCEEVRNSVKLKRIMQTILSLGNALNHGTARGSAVGFRLDSLLKLTDTRARNNKMTLMHYLCKVLSEKLPELLDFSEDLVNLEAATKIQLKYQAEEMQAISKGLEKVVQELTASENDGPISENFCKSLKEFLTFAESEVRSLASLYSGVGRNADALAQYFGEDPARCPFEQVVSTLLNFVRMFIRAHNENCKQLEFEKKKALKDAENAKAKLDTSKKEPENEMTKTIAPKVSDHLTESM